MLGTTRTILAILVMAAHLFHVHGLGANAVFGFYVISGYLMTTIMHKSYGYTLNGRVRFAINRFLRLWPMYFIAAILSVLVIALYTGTAVMQLPNSPSNLLSNIFMIFPHYNPVSLHPRLVPPSWALTVEICFYIFICIGGSKTLKRVQAWLLISIIYFALTYIAGLDWYHRFYNIFAASLPFSIGALLYFIPRSERFRINPVTLLSLILINTIVSLVYRELLFEIGFILNLGLMAAFIYQLRLTLKPLLINKRLDKKIGDLSYPIYLIHWPVLVAIRNIVNNEYLSYVITVAVVLLLSYLMVMLVAPIENMRDNVKQAVNSEKHLP